MATIELPASRKKFGESLCRETNGLPSLRRVVVLLGPPVLQTTTLRMSRA